MITEKQHLRDQLRQKRVDIDPASVDVSSAVHSFLEKIKPDPSQIVAGYYPVGYEFNVLPFLDEVLRLGGQCALPVIQTESLNLQFVHWDRDAKMQHNRFGIPEPVVDDDYAVCDPDIVLVPFLGFDMRGVRLGQGGGFYDATLEALRQKKAVLAVGMGYEEQKVDFDLPCEAHDERLDYVVTPEGVYRF